MHNSSSHRYDDIIDLPHHVSTTRPHMPIADRAAQFSPFAALTGYDSLLRETARLTDRRIELDEQQRIRLDARLQRLRERAAGHLEVSITYFVPDDRKDGGTYVTVSNRVKKIDEFEQVIVLENGTRVPVPEILTVAGELFPEELLE